MNAEIERFNERFQDLVEGRATPGGLLAAAPLLAEGCQVQREAVAEFRDLEPPSADAEVFEKITAALEEQAALVGRLADAAEGGDGVGFNSLVEELERTKTGARRLLQGYGFEECGSGSGDAD